MAAPQECAGSVAPAPGSLPGGARSEAEREAATAGCTVWPVSDETVLEEKAVGNESPLTKPRTYYRLSKEIHKLESGAVAVFEKAIANHKRVCDTSCGGARCDRMDSLTRGAFTGLAWARGQIAALKAELETIPPRSLADVDADIAARVARRAHLQTAPRGQSHDQPFEYIDSATWAHGGADNTEAYADFWDSAARRNKADKIKNVKLPILDRERMFALRHERLRACKP